MQTNKTQQLIDTLAKGTVEGKFMWKPFTTFARENLTNVSEKMNKSIFPFASYWIETETQYLLLLSLENNLFKIIISSKSDNEIAVIEITAISYYRLQSLINDQSYRDNKLIDDFFNQL